jgi:UDP-N-acetylglucosamine 1-carboxyvinyltransferase
MDRILVRGGRRLEGRVRISGSKNAALPIMAAAIACEEPVTIRDVPDLLDIDGMEHLLCSMGVGVDRRPGEMIIDPRTLRWPEAPYDLVRKMRASFFVLGPLIARSRRARVSLPGGCAIGSRPVDIHIKALEALNIGIQVEHGYVEATAEGKDQLVGQRVTLGFPSVGATENLLVAASVAKGTTIIHNAACEPEVRDLADFLVAMGANIEGIGSSRMVVEGVERLKGGEYTIIPDRIEAGTYLVAAAVTGGEVTLENACPAYMTSTLEKLTDAGAQVKVNGSEITIKGLDRPEAVGEISTLPYPGFPTDMQAQMMAMMTVANGTTVVRETIFENRFMHISELSRLGANISLDGSTAVVRGVDHLSGSPVMASDLRASAALVIAGLVAEGETEVLRVYHIDRGYEKIEEKLAALGADIERASQGGSEFRSSQPSPRA